MDFATFCNSVRAYCGATSGSITSWGRTRARNERVGGVTRSPHIAWLAVDVVYDDELLRTTRESLAREVGLKVIFEGDHDHLQPLDWHHAT